MQWTKYPDLKNLLEQKFAEWKDSEGLPDIPDIRTLAEEISRKSGRKIVFSAVYQWREGNAKPSPQNVRALARFFAPNNTKEQKRIVDAIEAATASPEVIVDPMMDVVEKRLRPLHVGVIPFPRFCELPRKGQRAEGFLGMVMRYFLRFAGFEVKYDAKYEEVGIDDVEDWLCDKGKVDVVLGLFVDPSRTRRLWFYDQMPISIPLNGVRARVFEKESDGTDLLKGMTYPDNSQEVGRIIKPIVDRRELGGIYVTQFLSFRDERYHPVKYDLETYAKKLKALSLLPTKKHPQLPMCVIDEVSCCRVQDMLSGDMGKGLDKNQIKLLVESPPDRIKERDFLPRYRYGFAIARMHERWTEFFSQTFDLFIEAHAELISRFYAELYRDLQADLIKVEACRISDWLLHPSTNDESSGPQRRGDYFRISPTWRKIVDLAQHRINASESKGATPSGRSSK